MKNMITEMIGSENFGSNDNKSQFVVQTKNFLVQICSLCNEEMELSKCNKLRATFWSNHFITFYILVPLATNTFNQCKNSTANQSKYYSKEN